MYWENFYSILLSKKSVDNCKNSVQEAL